MRDLINIVEEGLVGADVLYHWTKLSKLLDILNDNRLKAHTHPQLGDRKPGVSFTRTPLATMIRGNIILVIDATKLRQNYSLEPRFGDSPKAAEIAAASPELYAPIEPQREAEEFVTRDVAPLNRFLKAILVPRYIWDAWPGPHVSRSSPWADGPKIMERAKELGIRFIPVEEDLDTTGWLPKVKRQMTESAESPQTLQDVANHFLLIHDDLLDDEDDIGDEISEQDALEIIRRNYVSGTCAAFAVALHDKYGYPIVGIAGGLHVAVRTPDGQIMDFAGKNPLPMVLKRYGLSKGTSVEEWTREESVGHLMIDEDDMEDAWNDINIAKWVMNKLGKW